ncbi:sulfatase-like hydrolase/transferase [Blastopirellula marina]|uniref:sulfatase-like hydrolase/transferase n=1 Tax=Blastopirellula marina TaxID=124 RepID=UPI001304A9B2|nr:sulfatase-like hydrolase/transferase [Blastopirellula marina]
MARLPIAEEHFSGTDDNAYVSSLDNDLTRSLDQMVAAHGEVFEESDAGLQDRLADADRRLSSIKSEIRTAMRNANRQVRLPGQSSPLIMLVVLEGISKEELGFYGHPGATPLLEDLAERGTVFEACYAGPTPEIARYMLFTGSGHSDGDHRENLLAAMMWNSGYRPLLLENGNWIAKSERRFYDDSIHVATNADTHLPELLMQGEAEVRIVANQNDDSSDDVTTARLLAQQVRQMATTGRDRRPAFIQLHWQITATAPEERFRQIADIDQSVGRVFHDLQQKRGGRSMMLVVAGLPTEASVGTEATSLSEQSLQVPLMIHRTRNPHGATVAEPCGLLDVLPTLAEAIGSSRVPPHNGVSLLNWEDDSQRKKVTRVFRWSRPGNANEVAVRQGPWKAIFGATPQLFFLPDDPRETNDVADENQEVLEALAKYGQIEQR